MANNSFSIGHDVSLDIVDIVTGKQVVFPLVTGFAPDPITKQITSEPLNGPPLFAENPNGWKGTIDFDRTDSSIDIWFANREAAYYRGVSQFNVTITQTIQEKDGSVTQFRYPNVALKLADAGKWKASDKVSMRIDWMASTRIQVL
jgi:hypothetical protein